ncbi:MAG: HNH endonuclease, partial [Bifidobacteriaceae bacterium]|nr:HNH endonuclease [Bifidobacteriaceae bacterium]
MPYNPRRSNGSLRTRLRNRVLSVYDVCALCGTPVDKQLHTPHPYSPEVDEIIPVSLGGSPFEMSNLQLTHRHCNRQKSNKL